MRLELEERMNARGCEATASRLGGTISHGTVSRVHTFSLQFSPLRVLELQQGLQHPFF
jgi:hypothetical protein